MTDAQPGRRPPRVKDPAGPLDPAAKRRLKERGVLLATCGLLMGPAIGLALKLMDLAPISWKGLGMAVAATLVLQGATWWTVRAGWEAYLRWDPHYLYVPMLVAAFLLNLYIYLAPPTRYLAMLAWFVALLFMVGLAGFLEVAALSAVMTAGYLAVLNRAVAAGEPVRLALEHMYAVVFLIVSIYAGVVFERLRNERQEMHRLRARLSALASTDGLTGLPNRRHLERVLEGELASVARYGGRCALAMIDVDFFKAYNDTWGHLAGDAALRELGEVLRQHLRASDVLARYGGEEFGLVMRHAGREEALQTVERLRMAVDVHGFPTIDGRPEGRLTISAGVAVAPEHGLDYDSVVRAADAALYAAKRAGRNRVAG